MALAPKPTEIDIMGTPGSPPPTAANPLYGINAPRVSPFAQPDTPSLRQEIEGNWDISVFDQTVYRLGEQWLNPPEKDYNPWDHLDGYELYASDLVQTRSRAEMQQMKSRIDRNQQTREMLARGEWGWMASLMSGVGDPVNLIPVPGAMGMGFLKGAAVASAGNVALAAATAPVAMAVDPTATWEEQAYSIGGAALFGAAFGGVVGSIGTKARAKSRAAMGGFADGLNVDEGLNTSRAFNGKEEEYNVAFGNTRSTSPEGVYEPVSIVDYQDTVRNKTAADGQVYHYDDTHGWVLEADRGSNAPRAIPDEIRDELGVPTTTARREMRVDDMALRQEFENGRWKESLGADAIRNADEYVTFRQIEAATKRTEPKLDSETPAAFRDRTRVTALDELRAGRVDASVMSRTGLEPYLDLGNRSPVAHAIRLVKGDNILTDLPLQLGGDYGWAIRANKFGYKTPPSVLVRSLRHGASFVEVRQAVDGAWLRHVQQNQNARGKTFMSLNMTAAAESVKAGAKAAMGGKVLTKSIFNRMALRSVFDTERFQIDGFEVVPEAREAAKAFTRMAQRYDAQARSLGIFYDQASLQRTVTRAQSRLLGMKQRQAAWLWGGNQSPASLQPAIKVDDKLFFGATHDEALAAAMDELGPDIEVKPESYGYVDNLATSNDAPAPAPKADAAAVASTPAAFGEPALTIDGQVFKASDYFPNWEKGSRPEAGRGNMSIADEQALGDVNLGPGMPEDPFWGHADLREKAVEALGAKRVDSYLEQHLGDAFGFVNAKGEFKSITQVNAAKPAKPETITKPSISVVMPDGTSHMFDGTSHMDALMYASEQLGMTMEKLIDTAKIEDGFMTSTGRFVDRAEASKIQGTEGDLTVEKMSDQNATTAQDALKQAPAPASVQPKFRKMDDVLQSRIAGMSERQREVYDQMEADVVAVTARRDTAEAQIEHAAAQPHRFIDQFGNPEPYVPRFWHKPQIMENRAKFEKLVTAWYQRTQPIGAEVRAAKTVDDMLITDNGLDEEAGVPGLKHLQKRQLDIPNSFRINDQQLGEISVADFIELDMETVTEAYTRTMGTKIETAEMFGDTELFDKMQDIKAHFLEKYMMPSALKGKPIADIVKNRDEYLGWVELTRDAVLGGLRNKEAYNVTNRVAKGVKNAQMLSSMGRVLLTAAPEAMRLPMVNGFGTAFKAIWTRLFTDFKTIQPNVELQRQTGVMFEMAMDRRHAEIAAIGHPDPNGGSSWIERKLEQAIPSYFKLVGLSPWTVMMKDITMFATQHRIMDLARKVDEGSNKTVLAAMGISRRDAKMLASMPVEENGGLILPGVDKWEGPDGRKARRLFLDALAGEANRAIITPSIADKSLLFSGVYASRGKKVAESDWFTVPLQFMSFGIAANQKLLMSGLQGRDMNVVGGALAMLAGGVIANYMRTPSSAMMNKSWDDLLLEGYETAGLGGFWFGDLNGQIERATRHSVGLRPLLGMNPRYGKKTDVGDYVDMLGPAPGTWYDVASAFIDPEMTSTNRAQAIRRALPYNNVIWWGSVTRDLATAAGKTFGD